MPPPALIVLSAKNKDRLKAYAQNLIDYLHPLTLDSSATADQSVAEDLRPLMLRLEDVAYTLQVGREPMEERLGLMVGSIEQLVEKLQAYIAGDQGIADAYQGQVQPTKEGMSIISQDDDMKEAIDRWIARKKLSKLLSLWVKGLELDWNKLYHEHSPQRISLPTYPFARERYWIGQQSVVGSEKSKKQDYDAVVPENLAETLVGEASTSAIEESFELMIFEEVWQEEPLSEPSSVEIKTLLCFLSNMENQQAFVKAIKTLDPQAKVIFILQGRSYKKDSEYRYRVSRKDRDTYEKAFKSIRKDHSKIDAILYLWALEDSYCIQDLSSQVYILQAMASAGLKSKRLLSVGQFGNTLERCYLESWIGFQLSLGLVFPQTEMAAIYQAVSPQSQETGMKDWVQKLWGELQANKVQSILYQEGKRHVCQI